MIWVPVTKQRDDRWVIGVHPRVVPLAATRDCGPVLACTVPG